VSCHRRALLIGLALASAAACLWLTAATDAPPPATALPVPAPEAAGYCAALHARLPAEVGGLTRADPEPQSDLTAGWGAGAVVLRCGVPRPAEDADAQADGLDLAGVSWSFARAPDGAARVTTTLRRAYVEVCLRGAFTHDAGPLLDLAPAIRGSVPEGIAS
jgi:hypothetical protein